MLLGGRITSTLGDSIYQIAVIWHIYYLTNSTFYTGLATAFTMIPKTLNFLFGPWVEYHDKTKILTYSQFVQFLLMGFISFALYFQYENVWLILFVIGLVSFIGNIQGTSEISIVPMIMGKEEIPKFNSFVSSTQMIITMSMRGVFGFVILFMSVDSIYIFNAIMFLVAAIFFSRIQNELKVNNSMIKEQRNYKADLMDGFRHMLNPHIIFICLPFLVLNFMSGITASVLPAFAEFKIDLNAYGLFLLAMSFGALLGSISSYKLSKFPLKHVMSILPFFSFILWILAILINNSWVSIILFGLAFIPFGVMNVYFITYIQISISSEMLGRVSSIIDSFLVSTIPLGALIAGFLSKSLPITTLMLFSGSGLLFISLYFFFVRINENNQEVDQLS